MLHIDWEGICTSTRRKLKRACTLLGLKKLKTYERVKYATAGPVTGTYFELKMLCLFYFVLESEKKNRHNIETAVAHEKHFYFSLLYSFFFISIPNVN